MSQLQKQAKERNREKQMKQNMIISMGEAGLVNQYGMVNGEIAATPAESAQALKEEQARERNREKQKREKTKRNGGNKKTKKRKTKKRKTKKRKTRKRSFKY